MSIQNLMSAAHAAGFAMAVSDEFLVEDEKVEIAAKVVDADPERSVRSGPGRALALPMPVQQRTAWIREWLLGWRAGAPA